MILDNNPLTGLLKPPAESDSWLWATVTSTNPLLVRLDGENYPLAASPDTLTPVEVNDRVRVHLHQRRAVIVGKKSGAVAPPPPPVTLPALVWRNITLNSPWANYGSGYQIAQYAKDAQGFVHLRGLVRGGAINSAICTLPVGYRPPANEILAANTSEGNGNIPVMRLNIFTDGRITAAANFFNWVSLSGVYFHAK